MVLEFLRQSQSSRHTDAALLRGDGGLDIEWYCSTYTDILPTYAVEHYRQAGWREGRSPNANFSGQWYKDRYPRVVAADADPFLHFLSKGRDAGFHHAPHHFWDPRAWSADHGGVDPVFYRTHYRDIGPNVDCAAHYHEQGWREGKDPNGSFSTLWYLRCNADIAAVEIDPLHHYLMHGRFEGRCPRPTFLQTIRFDEWGVGKISMALALIYGTAVVLKVSILSIWPLLVLSLIALVPGAAFVALINDLSDRADDEVAGKANRMQGRSPSSIVLLLVGCILLGLTMVAYWHRDTFVVCAYLAAWLSFALYSLPPFRLKARGILGPLADACGAHVFPNLFLVASVFSWVGAPIDRIWLIAVGLWSAGVGLRGVLQHQLLDQDNDARSDIPTFVRKVGVVRVRHLVNAVIFPMEVLALTVLLWRVGSIVPVLIVSIYLALEVVRSIWLDGPVVLVPIAGSPARGRLVLFPFYEILMPIAIMASSTYLGTMGIAAAHVLLFTYHQMKCEIKQLRWLNTAHRIQPTAILTMATPSEEASMNA